MSLLTLPPEKLPCCGVYAVSCHLQKEFREVAAHVKILLKKSHAWKGRLTDAEMTMIINSYNLNIQKVGGRRSTLKMFAIEQLESSIVYITGHFIYVNEGYVFDQYHQQGIIFSEYLKKRGSKTVKKIYKLS